jgi:transcriptional regulator with XRE-family HTH domain
MTIEGLGKKFQEARLARKLTLEEAARITKIRPTRLAEIEADDFSQFPSLAYAKGFLLIYGKFLDVDVTPYLDAFEGSSNITINGYSYLQESPAPKPPRTPNIRAPRRPISISVWPLVIGVGVLVIGFSAIKLMVNVNRLAPRKETMIGIPEAAIPSATTGPTGTPVVKALPQTMTVAKALPVAPAPKTAEPEVRKAQPVRPQDRAQETGPGNSPPSAEPGETRVDIKPLKKTYIKVTVDNAAKTPEYERWISPSDGTVEFRGQHIAVRVLDREAIQIRKNGKPLSEGDSEVTIQ